MLLVITIANTPLHVSQCDIRALVVATLSRAMLQGYKIPPSVNILCVDQIKRSKSIHTAALRANRDGTNEIEVATLNRSRDEVLNSIFHELTHLLRVVNDAFSSDLVEEEVGNLAWMREAWPTVGQLMAIMLQECYETTIPNRTPGPLVRPGYSAS